SNGGPDHSPETAHPPPLHGLVERSDLNLEVENVGGLALYDALWCRHRLCTRVALRNEEVLVGEAKPSRVIHRFYRAVPSFAGSHGPWPPRAGRPRRLRSESPLHPPWRAPNTPRAAVVPPLPRAAPAVVGNRGSAVWVLHGGGAACVNFVPAAPLVFSLRGPMSLRNCQYGTDVETEAAAHSPQTAESLGTVSIAEGAEQTSQTPPPTRLHQDFKPNQPRLKIKNHSIVCAKMVAFRELLPARPLRTLARRINM
ncbi:hypothetical protein DFJ73DRAFT_900192, partial [Zopfochytrium polystomum]